MLFLCLELPRLSAMFDLLGKSSKRKSKVWPPSPFYSWSLGNLMCPSQAALLLPNCLELEKAWRLTMALRTNNSEMKTKAESKPIPKPNGVLDKCRGTGAQDVPEEISCIWYVLFPKTVPIEEPK